MYVHYHDRKYCEQLLNNYRKYSFNSYIAIVQLNIWYFQKHCKVLSLDSGIDYRRRGVDFSPIKIKKRITILLSWRV